MVKEDIVYVRVCTCAKIPFFLKNPFLPSQNPLFFYKPPLFNWKKGYQKSHSRDFTYKKLNIQNPTPLSILVGRKK